MNLQIIGKDPDAFLGIVGGNSKGAFSCVVEGNGLLRLGEPSPLHLAMYKIEKEQVYYRFYDNSWCQPYSTCTSMKKNLSQNVITV